MRECRETVAGKVMGKSTSVQSDETPVRAQGKSRSPLAVIFLTVFIDLVGFGIIIPLSPYLAREFQASAFEMGLLMAVYSFMQFVFSPFWGRLSDRMGRRPTLLVSILGGALSYLLFAFAGSFWVLFLSRALAGLFGGNISIAHAYIADVTPPSERSKGMGLLGAAFGLGFIFGPLIGGVLGSLGQRLGDQPPLGMSFAALGAAVLCLANFAMAYFSLRESLPPEKRGVSKPKRKRFEDLWRHARQPLVGPLIFVFFLSGLAMAQMETMLFYFVADQFGWGLEIANYGFAYVGVMMVITQGYLIRKWMPRFGEPNVLSCGLALFAISLFGIAGSSTVALFGISMTILALGNGMMRPPNLGMISLMTPAEEQGLTMGVTNSVASLGRILGPLLSGVLYERVGRSAPFAVAGVLAFVALATTLALYRRLPQSGRVATNA